MSDLFSFSPASLAHLEEGSRAIQEWALLMLKLSVIDGSVVDCGRSREEQELNIIAGVSWTMESDHLLVPSEAIDIYPWVDGKTSHDIRHYNLLAKAGFTAAAILGTPMDWGGLWIKSDDPKINRFDPAHWATHRGYRG